MLLILHSRVLNTSVSFISGLCPGKAPNYVRQFSPKQGNCAFTQIELYLHADVGPFSKSRRNQVKVNLRTLHTFLFLMKVTKCTVALNCMVEEKKENLWWGRKKKTYLFSLLLRH